MLFPIHTSVHLALNRVKFLPVNVPNNGEWKFGRKTQKISIVGEEQITAKNKSVDLSKHTNPSKPEAKQVGIEKNAGSKTAQGVNNANNDRIPPVLPVGGE